MICQNCGAEVKDNQIHGRLACYRNLLAFYQDHKHLFYEEEHDAVVGERKTADSN